MSLLQKMFGKRQNRTHPYCAALIAAAGSSTRYGGENKLLQTLDGIPVLVRTLLTIDRVEGIDEIVIAAREDELLPYAELCKTFGLRKPVKVIVGGATRTESVLRAALEASPLPEVQYFLEHFIPAFERDLDELGAQIARDGERARQIVEARR